MYSHHLAVLLAMGSFALAQDCPTAVFSVRGSSSNPDTSSDAGYDDLPSGMTAVCNAVGVDCTAIMYPSTDPTQDNLSNGNYAKSVGIGINALQNAVTSYVASCPDAKIFVQGYSQGAQVVSGALAGSTFSSPNYGAIDAHRHITGALVFADPGFVNSIPIDAGSAVGNGFNGSVTNNGDQYNFLQQNFSGRFTSYCQSGDEFCNVGGNTGGQDPSTIHGAEPETYQGAASSFFQGLNN